MSSRLALILMGILLVGGLATAQTSSPPQSDAKPPIELKLSSTSLMMCIGSSIPLELELTNRGPEEFKVDKYDIWNQFNYGFLGGGKIGRGGGMSSSCHHCLRDPISVAPDQTYKSSFDFDLNHDFFKDAGKYKIKLTIAGVESNDIEFELFHCE